MQRPLTRITKCIPFTSIFQWNVICTLTKTAAKTKQEINRIKEEKEARKLLKLLPHLPKKKQRIVESFLQTRWHNLDLSKVQTTKPISKREQSQTSISNTPTSNSTAIVPAFEEEDKVELITYQRLKETKVQPGILQFIRKHNLGFIKKVKGRYPVSPIAVSEEISNFFNHRFFRFRYAVTNPKSFPPITLPEIGFAGRSNVGKSKLINALIGTGIVRSSPKPGLTQSINFFHLNGRLALVDFPGYGFALAKNEKVTAWNDLIRSFFKHRSLKLLFLLVDARVGLKTSDLEYMKLLDEFAEIGICIIQLGTECDTD